MENIQPINTERIFYLCGSLACVNLKYVKSVCVERVGDKWVIVASFSREKIILEEDISETTIRNMFYSYNKYIGLMSSVQYLIKEEK